jgi:putative sterol carrier protein
MKYHYKRGATSFMAETPKEFMELLKAKLNGNPDAGKGINAIFQFLLAGENGGDWWIDLTKSPAVVEEGNNVNADCTISMDADDFTAMMKKTANPISLFMSKKLTVAGDMMLSMKLQSILNVV